MKHAESILNFLNSATYLGQKFLFGYSLHYLVARALFYFSPRRKKMLEAEELYLESFLKDGYCVMPDFVGDQSVEALEQTLKGALSAPGQSPKWAETEPYSNIVVYNYPVDYLKQVQYLFNWEKQTSRMALEFLNQKFGRLIQKIFRSNYSVEHIWFYETKNDDHQETFNLNSEFHLDGDVSSALKVIIYMCDVDESNGPLKVHNARTSQNIVITGKKGTAILFKANKVPHAATNTVSANRYALSFMIQPNIRYGYNYRQMPMNASRRVNPFFAARKVSNFKS